jgi:FkbM family methyltransferase
MNKNIFLDLGSHYCEGLTQFVFKILPIDSTWEIHLFEPNPLINTEESYNNTTLNKNNLNIQFHKKAVWTKDGEFVFKMFGNNGCSVGSLLEETKGDAHYKDYHSSEIVECVDLWKFINTNFDLTDKIYIKMDIEWAEYIILQDMIDKGWPQNIVTIWVEFHGLNEDNFREKSKNLTNIIQNNYQTNVILWH